MSFRGVIGAAVVLYAVVLAFVLLPGWAPADEAPAAATQPAPGGARTRAAAAEVLPLRGVAIQVQRVDWAARYKESIDEIAAVGADAVSFVVDARQENGSSSRIYLDLRMTPTPQMLGELIDYAKSKGLRVMLMPIVLLDAPRGTEWRGRIQPVESEDGVGGWDDWWDSYRAMMIHFAWVAERHDVDVLVVGSELVSTEHQTEQWTRTINAVRKSFSGLLTYSSNWDHYTAVTFWDQLDIIAMNSYWEFVTPRQRWTEGAERDVTVELIKNRWREIQSDLVPFVERMGKPLLFTEVGWASMASMAHEPWDYTLVAPPTDPEMQRKLYQGFFESWHGHPHLGGFMIWEWPPGDGGTEDRGYTPEDKPAEQVLREWLNKPWE